MNVARSLLRQLATTTSRSKGSSTRAIVAADATSVRGIMRGNFASSSPVSYFCTGVGPSPDIPPMTSSRSFSSKSILLDILAREENEEVETGNTELPEDLSDLRATIQESWKIVENGASTNLYKIDSPSGNKIQVSFHCQDTLEVEQDEDEAYSDDEEGEDDEPAAPVRFTVTVTKAGKSLNFACFSEYGEVKIEGVSTTASSSAEYIHENQGTLPKIEYQGPDFTELAEDLQEALADYLEEDCGVNSDLAAFVAMSADYREEIDYVDFLKQAQSIVS